MRPISLLRDDGGAQPDLDHRLRARALALALEPDVTAAQAADALIAMAGATPAAPIAARRALARLTSANGLRPSERTARAIEALRLTLARVQQPSPNSRATSRQENVDVRTARGERNR